MKLTGLILAGGALISASAPAKAQVDFLGVTIPGAEDRAICIDSLNIYVSGDVDCEIDESQDPTGITIGTGITLDGTTNKATFNGPVDINGNLQASGIQAFSGTSTFNSTVSFVGPSVTFSTGATFQNPVTFNGAASFTNGLTANTATITTINSGLISTGTIGVNDFFVAGAGANINMGGNRVHGVAAGTAATDAVNVAQLNAATAENAYIDINSTGPAATATGVDAIAIGEQVTATGDRSVAIGTFNDRSGRLTEAAGGYSVAMGPGAQTTAAGAFGVAIGPTSTASAEGAVAIGGRATASAAGSVAIGAGSVANQANTVSIGRAGAERRIVNVAAGTAATDAVNLGQLNAATSSLSTSITALQTDTVTLFDLTDRLRGDVKDANEGVAMALAMDNPNVPAGARFALSGGIGYFKNRAAFAAAISAAVGEMSSVSAGLGYGLDSNEIGARAGFQIAW